MAETKPTKKMIEGLRWIKAREPIGWFTAEAPSKQIRNRLIAAGWIEPLPCDPRSVSLQRLRLTDAGRAVIAAAVQEVG